MVKPVDQCGDQGCQEMGIDCQTPLANQLDHPDKGQQEHPGKVRLSVVWHLVVVLGVVDQILVQ